MREIAVRLHRYVGLMLAVFLLLSAVTGSVLAFHREIDRFLNPDWFVAQTTGPALPLDAIVAALEARYPTARVSRIALPPMQQSSWQVWLEPRPASPGSAANRLAVNQVFVDPARGAILGARLWGALRVDRAHAVPFLYELHHRLHLGTWGAWLLGGVAVLWLLDSLVALYLAWPRPRWAAVKRAFSIKKGARGTRRQYDLHRAGGLWVLPVLLVLAVSGAYLNVPDVVRAALAAFIPVSPMPGNAIPATPRAHTVLGWDAATARARAALDEPDARLGDVRYRAAAGVYRVAFHAPGDIAADVPGTARFVSAADGAIVGAQGRHLGTVGDAMLQWLFPLHSGRAFGFIGRAIIALCGVITIVLIVTGYAIWRRKHRGATHRLNREGEVARR